MSKSPFKKIQTSLSTQKSVKISIKCSTKFTVFSLSRPYTNFNFLKLLRKIMCSNQISVPKFNRKKFAIFPRILLIFKLWAYIFEETVVLTLRLWNICCQKIDIHLKVRAKTVFKKWYKKSFSKFWKKIFVSNKYFSTFFHNYNNYLNKLRLFWAIKFISWKYHIFVHHFY